MSGIRGVDMGWLPAQERMGLVFRNFDGKPIEMFSFLKTLGIAAIRQRVFVNPSDDPVNGGCDIKTCVEMGRRAAGAGMDFMVNFHYSDTWTNPKLQDLPAAWAKDPYDELCRHVYDHTVQCLTELYHAGIQPKWVQVGNEIDNGLMLPVGDPKTAPDRLTGLLNAGYDAVRAVFPKGTQVILHLASGWNLDFASSYLENILSHGGKFDIFGTSYYPYWVAIENPDFTHEKMKESARKCFAEIKRRYGIDSMIVEIGAVDAEEERSYQIVRDMVELSDDPANSCLGVFYWEPQGFRSFSKYVLSAWKDDGTPSKAMLAFCNQ